MTARRRTQLAASRRRSPWIRWLPWIGVTVMVVLVIGWGITSYSRLQQRVGPLADMPNSHGFIEQKRADRHNLLLIRPAKSADQIEQLAVIQADFGRSKLVVLELPANLSDGQTMVSTYWRAEYYKELQQMIEQQLALPLTGYIVDQSTTSWSSVLTLEEPVGWLQSTVGLPQWLGEFDEVKTSLAWSDWLKLLWLSRDASSRQEQAMHLSETAIVDEDGWLVVKAEEADPQIRQWFADPVIAQVKTTVVVENATAASGLAAQMGRVVANIGGEVVATVPADSPETRSQLIAAEESAMTEALSQFLGIPVTIKAQTGRERSEVELVLGSDALSRLGR